MLPGEVTINGLRKGTVAQTPAGSPPKLLARFDDGVTMKVLLAKVRKIAADEGGAPGEAA